MRDVALKCKYLSLFQMAVDVRWPRKLIGRFNKLGILTILALLALVRRAAIQVNFDIAQSVLSSRFIFKGGLPAFKPYNDMNTTTMYTVCLTQRKVKYQWSDRCGHIWETKTQKFPMFCKGCLHEQKSITVYVNNQTDLDSFKKTNWMETVGFKIEAKLRSELPKDHVIIRNQTAYFLGRNGRPREPYNFFHFTKQIFFPLYHLIKSTNQLQEGAQNIIFYAGPYALCERDKRVVYFNVDKYKYFRDLLYIKNKVELSAYVDRPDPDKICYENAVFSGNFFLHKAVNAIDFFKNSLDIRDDVCQPKTLTIIDRSTYRRILNTKEIKTIAEDLGYHVTIAVMEKLTLKQQAQLIHCTDVLVGVTGAGLQWAYFMKNHSTVFEIAWPEKEWYFFFSSNSSSKPVIFFSQLTL